MSGIKSSIIVRKLTQQNDEQHKYRTSAKLEEDSKKKDSFKYLAFVYFTCSPASPCKEIKKKKRFG